MHFSQKTKTKKKGKKEQKDQKFFITNYCFPWRLNDENTIEKEIFHLLKVM